MLLILLVIVVNLNEILKFVVKLVRCLLVVLRVLIEVFNFVMCICGGFLGLDVKS